MFKSIFPLASVVFFLQHSAVLAQTEQWLSPQQQTERQQLREQFSDAERSAARANEREFAELAERFGSYPLWPYIEAAYLRNNIALTREQQIRSFLEEYHGTQAERQVRNAWLAYLARRNLAERYIRDYVHRGDSNQHCRYLSFQLNTQDEHQELWPQVEERWLQGSSQPRTCDPVFAAWEAAGKRTEAHVWQRFELALQAREWGLARYLRSLLPEKEHDLAQNLMRIARSPAQVRNFEQLPADNSRSFNTVQSAFNRLIWQNQELALQLWPRLKAHFDPEPDEIHGVEESIAVMLSLRGHEEALHWFRDLDVEELTASGLQWYLAALLRESDFTAVLALVESLPEEAAATAQSQYWRARALEELERPVEAEAIWRQLAQQRNFYGFMASAVVRQTPELHQEQLNFDSEALENLWHNYAGVQRAYEFFQLGRYFDARSEWNLLRTRLEPEERRWLVALSSQWQWHDQSIHELARLGLTNDIERRFPLGFQETLIQQAEQQDIDPAWAFAVIRRESAFQQDAVSPVGARGLMQVMPDTARYLARSNPGRSDRRDPDLHDPEDNIRLGTRYMAEMLRRTDNNWLLATASYNAGIYRVQEWIPEQQTPADIWIETIPYQETRDYVKAVLAYQQIYTMLLGREENILNGVHSLHIYQNGGLCLYGQTESEQDSVC